MSQPQKSPKPRPPEKGAFPLDHEGECKAFMKAYMDCMKESKFSSSPCRPESKKYLECRMEKDLMAQEDLSKLGFRDLEAPGASAGK